MVVQFKNLLLQNRSSFTESVHANTEASVSAHRLDSSVKSMDWLSKEREIW